MSGKPCQKFPSILSVLGKPCNNNRRRKHKETNISAPGVLGLPVSGQTMPKTTSSSSGCSRLASVRANHAQNHIFHFRVFSACQIVRQTMHTKNKPNQKNKPKTLQLGVFSDCQLAVRQTTSTTTISSDCSIQSPRLGQGVEGKRVAGKPLTVPNKQQSQLPHSPPASKATVAFLPSGWLVVVLLFSALFTTKTKDLSAALPPRHEKWSGNPSGGDQLTQRGGTKCESEEEEEVDVHPFILWWTRLNSRPRHVTSFNYRHSRGCCAIRYCSSPPPPSPSCSSNNVFQGLDPSRRCFTVSNSSSRSVV